MSTNGDRRGLLERYGRWYGEHGLAVAFTSGIEGEQAKRCTTKGWDKTRPLADGDFGASYVRERGERRNPVLVVRPSNLVSLECDGPEERAMIEALELPATVTVRSSAPDKLHFHFRPPAEAESLPFVAFRVESGRVTADETRYFVCPPSLHPSGAVYEFLPGLGPGEVDFAELPGDTYQALVARARREAAETKQRVANGGMFRHGDRGDAIFRFACMQRRWYGDDEQAILDEALRYNERRCDPPIERDRVEAQVRGAMKKPGGQEQPREQLTETLAATIGEPTLHDVLDAVRRYLELNAQEAIAFAVTLAVATSRDLTDEEPLWLMLVGAPGSGKTEAILLGKLTADGRVDELTRAGLLSWSSTGKKTKRTGLLTRIPEVAFVTISDFSTVVTMGDREARARMFGALRVIYDGRLYARSAASRPAKAKSSSGKGT